MDSLMFVSHVIEKVVKQTMEAKPHSLFKRAKQLSATR